MTCISKARDIGPNPELGLTTHTTSFMSHNPFDSPTHLEIPRVLPLTPTVTCDKPFIEVGPRTDVGPSKNNSAINPELDKPSTSYQTAENGNGLHVFDTGAHRKQPNKVTSNKLSAISSLLTIWNPYRAWLQQQQLLNRTRSLAQNWTRLAHHIKQLRLKVSARSMSDRGGADKRKPT